ncbi:response regulator [Candidatus Parcubacteria bacterium]|nr:response regulator [Candidatus Parcubacteria bacterium]
MSKVLLVEDEQVLSSAFKLVLEKAGYKVKTASDGMQALELTTAFKPDLILLDLLMPVMDGFEFLRKFNIQTPKSRPVIVVLSNLQDDKNIKMTKDLGVQEYIVKSELTPSSLVAIVRQHTA